MSRWWKQLFQIWCFKIRISLLIYIICYLFYRLSIFHLSPPTGLAALARLSPKEESIIYADTPERYSKTTYVASVATYTVEAVSCPLRKSIVDKVRISLLRFCSVLFCSVLFCYLLSPISASVFNMLFNVSSGIQFTALDVPNAFSGAAKPNSISRTRSQQPNSDVRMGVDVDWLSCLELLCSDSAAEFPLPLTDTPHQPSSSELSWGSSPFVSLRDVMLKVINIVLLQCSRWSISYYHHANQMIL